ncbi:carboxypeptidase M32 [Limnoraphis robusta]|uniref:Metal-dependent carboxypeptidase n=1 Tax=Limnoraphis robusta CCNP1315 TaxID=3110306 RepID=A0ABU5U7J1_9CYAN|nr:carboxypeptidase M32 [Limnoraphis robusta]MEA5523141.1 carboxypeptidase M32 [Limnoraphis robusta CCNP1315]MEA5545382.1 carboxypeptidase M32 [Limnoraphis robusta CCNP1324]
MPLPNKEPKLIELEQRLSEVNDIESVVSLLNWDQATYMPAGGAAARGRQIATLKQIAHEKLTDPALGQLLEDLRPYEANLSYDSLAASLIRIARRDYQRAIRVPSEFMARLSRHQAAAYEAWSEARPANDFAKVQPYLEKTLDLSQELASFFTNWQHIADPLIEANDDGMNVAIIQPIFHQLRQQLLPLVEAIAAAPAIDNSCLHQFFAEQEQLSFIKGVIFRLGYDFNRGRQDQTLHPFTSKFSIGDVRITTRIYEHHLEQALFSTIHETGHALYEQGIAPELEGTPLATGTASSVHESQSRLWENLVGRSRGFWEWFYPQLQGTFMRQLGQTSIQQFYRAINKVQPSLIRTDADEVTYNLHVMIRFDLELAMLEGSLAVQDLPQAWNERYQKDLGIIPPNDTNGVLQDVHWYVGLIGGMFHGYTLGNLISAQFYEAAIVYDPEIPVEIERGNFQRLQDWLKLNIYQHGRKYTAQELLERVTGNGLSIDPFMNYIRNKYGYLYNLKF